MDDQSKRQTALYKYKSANPTKEKALAISSIQTKPTTCHLLQSRLSSARLIAKVIRPHVPAPSPGLDPNPISLNNFTLPEWNPSLMRLIPSRAENWWAISLRWKFSQGSTVQELKETFLAISNSRKIQWISAFSVAIFGVKEPYSRSLFRHAADVL